LSELKEFQQAAVDRITSRLSKGQSGRFLLADEVGLGKTLIASGVIQQLYQQSNKRQFSVVYLCSNMEIAAQNAEKLAPLQEVTPIKDRLTLLSLADETQARKSNLRIYSFTPGTSLNLGRATGVMRERRLILYLLSEAFGQRIGSRWREFFRCSAGKPWWHESCKLNRLRDEFCILEKKRGFIKRWRTLVRQQHTKLNVSDRDKQEFRLIDELPTCVAEYRETRNRNWTMQNRNVVISELRKCLAVASLGYLDPDIVVMDEFQRFKSVLQNSRDSSTVESKLLSREGSKILILSATPYKMYTQSHESEDHHEDFLDTFAFLNNCELDDKKVKSLQGDLASFRSDLESITPNHTVDEQLLEKRKRIEKTLRQVMSRTERNRYIEDARKGVTEVPEEGEDLTGVWPREAELTQYIQLRKFLLSDPKRARDYGRTIMDFWKSGPSLLSFMDGHYAMINRLRENEERIPSHLLLSESQLRKSYKANLKFQKLFATLFDNRETTTSEGNKSPDDWPFLWIKPSFTYFKDQFYLDRSPSKFLVFSHWNFVPKTIAFLTSAEAERRMRFHKDKFKSSPFTFKESTRSIFNATIPSIALASEIDQLELSRTFEQDPTQKELEKQAQSKVRDLLRDAGVQYQKDGPSDKTWQIIAALESKHCDREDGLIYDVMDEIQWDGLVPSTSERSKNEWFKTYQSEYHDWLEDGLDPETQPQIRANSSSLRTITRIALYSPANIILRSLLRVADQLFDASVTDRDIEPEAILLGHSAAIGIGAIRNYFNKPLVQAVVGRYGKGDRYVDKVLDYCGKAHLQSVMDEFIFLQLSGLNGDCEFSKIENLAETIAAVFSMQIGTPRINVSDQGRLKTDSTVTGSTHFALAFGDDVHVENDGEEKKSRKSAVRTAFNSPFWPFVLATTSVGQEGLDFHLYCKDIVHWNLPSNPVDLEQREGRLNRFNSQAIRKMISRDYPIRDLKAFQQPDQSSGLPWGWVFDEIEADSFNEQHFKHGLYPHWIYKPKDGNLEILRRHLMFYSNSRDIQKYKKLKQDLSLYRLVFGQPRQEDVVRKIRSRLGTDVSLELLNAQLPIYMIDLSPFSFKTVWKLAVKKGKKIMLSQQLKSDFLQQVRGFVDGHRNLPGTARKKIDHMASLIKNSQPGKKSNPLLYSIAALHYLVNPFDATYDFYRGIGFEDDFKLIEKVHKKYFGKLVSDKTDAAVPAKVATETEENKTCP
jgi:uncharacterized membrane protein YkvA (DUF1232 family)